MGLYISLAAYTSAAVALAACTAKDRIQVQGRLDRPEVYQGADGAWHAGLRMTTFSVIKQERLGAPVGSSDGSF